MPINSKIKSLYDALKADGADVGSEQEFSDWFQAPGEQGYNNRKYVYDTFKADGADVGKNYEEFAGWLGLHAMQPQEAQAGTMRQPTGQTAREPQSPQPGGQQAGQVAPREVVATQATDKQVAQAAGKKVPVAGMGELTDEDFQAIESSNSYKPLYDSKYRLRNAPVYRGGVKYNTNLDQYIQKAVDAGLQSKDRSQMSQEELLAERELLMGKYSGGATENAETLQDARELNDIEHELVARNIGFKNFADMRANRGKADYILYSPDLSKEWLDYYEKQGSGGVGDGNNPLFVFGWKPLGDKIRKDQAQGVNTQKTADEYLGDLLKDKELEDKFYAYCLNKARRSNQSFRSVIDASLEDFKKALNSGNNHHELIEDEKGVMGKFVGEELDRMDDEYSKQLAAWQKRYATWLKGRSVFADDDDALAAYIEQTGDNTQSILRTAMSMSHDSRKTLEEAMKSGGGWSMSGFTNAAVRGIKDTALDWRTWTFGISDLSDARNMNAVAEKFLNNQPLSQAEQSLLDQMALKAATDAFFQKYLTTGYKAGATTGEALPFILEMMTGAGEATQTAVKSVGVMAKRQGMRLLKRIGMDKLVSKTLAYMNKKIAPAFGKLAGSRAGKVVAGVSNIAKGVGSAAIRGAGHALSTGGAKTLAGGYEGMTGQVDPRFNEQTGHFETGGFAERQSAGQAFGTSFMRQAGEYGTEFLGDDVLEPILGAVNRFGRRVAGKTMEKLHLKGVMDFLGDMKGGDIYRTVQDFRKQVHYNGSFGEYLEEVANNVYNAAFVGDQNFDITDEQGNFSLHEKNSVFNLEDNWDTYVSCKFMSGLFGVANVAGYRTPKYRLRQDLKLIDQQGRALFADDVETWDLVKATVETGDGAELSKSVKDIITGESVYNEWQRKAIVDYVGTYMRLKGIEQGEAITEDSTPSNLDEAFEAGYNGESPETTAQYNEAVATLQQQGLQPEAIDQLVTRDQIQTMLDGDVWSDEQKQATEAYITAKAMMEGMRQSATDEVESRVYSESNGGDGMIHPAVLKGEDEVGVNIVSGNVVTLADGTIDVANSDPDIVVVDANGERKMVSINDIASVGDVVDPNAVVDAAVQANAPVAGVEVGGRYNVVDEQNTQHEVEVLRDNGNGTLMVRVDGAEEPQPMVKAQLEAMLGIEAAAVPQPSEQTPADAEATNDMVEADVPEAGSERYSVDPNADGMAMGMAGFSEQDIAATVDYLNGKLGDREYLETVGISADTLDATSDEQIASWVNSIVERASEFITDATDEAAAVQPPTEQSAVADTGTTATPEPIGTGIFGNIYDQFKGKVKEAIGFLLGRKEGVAKGALHHKDVGDIDLWYGNDNAGLKKIAEKHPEVLQDLQGIIDGMHIKEATDNRIILESDTHKAVVSKDWYGKKADNWLLTAYEKKDASGGSIDIGPEPQNGKQNGTAPLQDNLSQGKGSENISSVQAEDEKSEAMPMLEDGNPDYSQVDASRAHDYLYSDESGLDKNEADEYVQAQIDAAEKALSKIDKKPLKMGTDLAKYRAEKQRRQEQLDAAKANVDYWERVKAIKADREAQAAAERKAKDTEVIAQAQAEEQARQAAEVAKQQEQAERGSGAVHPAIAEKWNNAPKIEGYKDEVVLANGERVPGTYYLVESGAVTPSHNASREFEKYEGFPVDENGNTINDRDYERDKDAQNITRSIADNYDSRALQTPVIVSKDGVVLSGNGRTMAGELAASNNTDGAYIEHLKNYGRKYGFTPEQVSSMQHPRAVFVPDADMPYTTETFAKFNAQEMKGQSKTEQAVKLGKVVDDATFNQIVRAINEHDTLGDFYSDTKAATEAINALRRAGAINDMQYAEMFDGDAVSDRGRQIIENMLIGKAFEGNPDVVRMLTEYKGFRQSVVTALNEISTNVALGKDYSLENELAQAIELAYKARKAGFKENELVSPYATQLNLFPFEDGETVADYNNAAVLLLADMLNDKRPTLLKKKLQDYNQQSAESAAGQMDIFSGSVKDKREIIKTVLNTLHNGETEETQRPEQRGPVADERGGEASLQEDGAAAGSTGAERSGRSEKETPSLTHDEAISLIAEMEEHAEVAPEIELTIENWDAQFGEDGRVATPIGEVKMGENQFTKLMRQGREGKLGMIKPTLENPDIIIEDASEAKEGDVAERKSSYVFVKAFKKADDSRYYYFTSITVSKDGKEVVVSSQEKSRNRLLRLMTEGKMLWRTPKDATTASVEQQGLDYAQPSETETATKGSGITPQSTDMSPSAGKVSANDSDLQAKVEKNAENERKSNIQGLESYSEEELRVIVEKHVRSAIADADMDAEITGIRFIGSRTTGTARADSDLDVLVEYHGTAREDSLFNVLNDEDNRLVIDGITVDINPITPSKSGTIEEFMRRNAGYKKETTVQEQIALAEQQTETSPSEAQKEAGNYKKGHVKIDGFDISIEQPKGSVRSGVDASGKSWSQKMNNTYGYIRGTEGVDGDHIDVFLSDDPSQGDVFVVDQVNNDGSFDEHKVMYGFNSEEDARQAYLSNYEDGWQGLGAITAVSKDEFKKWVDSSHRKTKPFAEYKNVKVGGTQEQEPKQQGTLFPATEQQPSSKSETKPRTTEKQPAEAPKERIDDVGEKIEGAKKDLAKKMGERINLDADTFPKMFPKYDLKKLISQGLDPNLAVMTKMLRQMAQADYKHYSKKRMYGKSYALRAARFYAAYAKQVLEAGASNVDFKSEGLGFTDYGKQFVELNKRLFEELYNKLGDDLFDLDLAGVKIQPLSQKEGSTWFRRNQETGEMEPYNPAYAFVGPRGQNYYEANELDKALQEGVEQVTKSIDYKKAHPYKLGHYYKPGIKNSDYVGVKLGGKIVPLTEPMTSSEVRKYMSEHNAELQAKAAQLDEQRKLDKKKGGTGEGRWKPELTLGGGRPRVGVDRRGGVDVEPEEFRKAFSFRGVQFGNYVTQRERQRFLNEAYDALMDMAELLGISPRAIAIDGRLGFAIGARGGGKANAHYEPKENVINLTKSKGAGSLAHEWFHALDYYFNRGNKKPTASTANKSTEQFPASTRNEMRKAFLDLMSAIKNSDYFKRSENLEMKLRSGKLDEGYYDKPTELAARAFQDYVVRKLADQGKINDFLSSFTSEEEWNGEPENYPFPIGAEAEKIDEKFDALFDAMQERTDEEGNTILYHLGKDHDVLTDTEIALRDGLVDILRSVGLADEPDEVKGQKELDSVIRAVELLDEMKKKSAPETAPLTNIGGSSADISSADGAKILQNIETLAKKYENISNYRKNFLDELAVAIGAKEEPTKKKKKDEVTSNSKYATFKTLAGTEVTIRLANHNATVSNFDNNGEQEGISIVISKRANQGITNNGNAHIVEFFYPEIGLRKAGGKPLVEIILSLGQALRSGEYKDTTGLATPQEVNGTMLQEMRGWHGSAAEFDEFDHSHMSEGEGNQAIGYGTYIASIEEIGRYYGTVAAMQKRFRAAPGYGDYDHYWKGQKIDLSSINPLRMAYDIVQREGTIKKAIAMVEKFVDNPEAHEGWRSALDILRESRKSDFKRKRANYEGERYLYEVDIPENDGTNYLPWDEPLSDAMRERIAQGLRDMGVDLNEPFERRSGKADNFDFLDEQMSEHPITGQELYYKLVDRFGRYPQQASEFLNKYCGLVGIEYPSNFFSGGNKKGLKNHVIFNEKDIKIDNRTQYFISADGVVYGFVKDGKIYIDPKIATAETPIHEYCHLWTDALKRANPEAWERLKEAMLGEKDVLEHVKRLYPELDGDELLGEVFSHYSGKRGAERLRADMEREMKNAEDVFAKARVAVVFDKIRRALSRFWQMARDLFAGKNSMLNGMRAEDFADMAMADMLRGFDPRGEEKDRGEAMVANEDAVLYEPMARTTGPDIEIVNSRFNEELQKQIDGTLPKGHVYKLGKPSAILLSTGIADVPIELSAKKLEEKSSGFNHDYELSEVKDLVKAINKPVAVFSYGNKGKAQNIVVEIQHKEKNFIVGLSIRPKVGDSVLEINSIRNVFPKDNAEWLNWISQGKHLYLDKEKIQTLIDQQRTNLADVEYLDLEDIAKIVKDFDNPSIKTENYVNERGDVIRFESHAEQLSLFGGGQADAVRQPTEQGATGALSPNGHTPPAPLYLRGGANGERVKRASEMSDAELLSEMGRDIAELEKAGRADWGVQTLYSEEYDRRHIKEYNEECDRVRTMLEENNVDVEQAEQMLLDTIYTWRDGYATADRSRPLAQFDTLNSYYAEKEWERDNADLIESEAAAMQQPTGQTADETVILPQKSQKPKRAGGFDPSAIKLRKLKGGETCYVERRYQESGSFDFTGSEKVESDADLAYIFRNLENSAIENTFLVLIKNGKATILHVGMGGYAFSPGHLGAGVLAASQLKPDHVIFVHNHPSGTLKPSQQDVAMQEKVKKMFGADKVREAIIIDITSGKYSIFDSDGSDIEKQRPTSAKNEVPYKTYSFGQQVFAKDYVPESSFQITDSNKAAEFISGHRLGERDKLSLIVLNRQKRVTGNIFLPWTSLDGVDVNKAADVIAKFIHQMGGESGILYGSGTISSGTLKPLARAIANYEVRLDDFINVEGVSAQVQGVLEEGVEYQPTAGNTGPANEVGDVINKEGDIELDKHTLNAWVNSLATLNKVRRHGVVVPIYDEEDVRRLKGVVSDELYDAVLNGLHSPNQRGFCDLDSGFIVVYTGKLKTAFESESTWWHENTHLAYDQIEIADKDALGLAALAYVKEHDKSYKDFDGLMRNYKRDQLPGEGACRLMQYIFRNWGSQGIMQGNFVGNEKIAKLATAIQNYLKYGETREEETSNRLRQSSTGTYGEFAEPRPRNRFDSESWGQEVQSRGSRGIEAETERSWILNEEGEGYGEADISQISGEPRREALSDVERAGQRGRQPGQRGSNEQSDDRGWQRASLDLAREEGVLGRQSRKARRSHSEDSQEDRRERGGVLWEERQSLGLAREEGVGYGEADDSGISDEELAGYDAGRYSFAESITQGLVELATKNADDQQLRMNAMREFGGNLSKLRKIMNKQRAYDRATVNDIIRLTRMVMGNGFTKRATSAALGDVGASSTPPSFARGFFKDMSAYEVKRLLAAIKKGVGVEDLTPIANNVVDMLVQHQLRESKAMLHKLMQVRGRKVDARGVEVQAGLDIDGQRMMSALKDGMSLGENGLLTRINDCENRLGSEDEVIRKNAMSEYQGLMLAKEYHDNILSGEEEEIVLRQEKRQEQEKIYDFRRDPVLDKDGNAIMNLDGSVRTVERKTLKPQFKNNVTDENKQLRRNTEAAIERIEQSIRESRMERVTSYIDFMSDVAGDVRASRERAAVWRAEQQERIDAIHHNANSDLEGVPVQSQTKMPEGGLLAFNSNNDIVRLLFQPLATFEKMLRFFGRKAHNGEGYLFNRFMRGWVDCSDKEWRSKRAAHEELDSKVRELFGKKAKRWSDLYEVERNKKHPGIPVEYWDNGERVQETMSQGEALSLVVWSKQKDAEAGLRRMGISEEDIETIKSHLDPKFLELANWVVEEFLPKRREYYNEVHERMFGAPMAAIEHYFPIVRNSRDVEKPSDITERDLGDTKPSTITGNIIKRQRTAAALDVHTDFFDHLLKHLDDMENWAAWAEFNRDINTLRNYKRFKNRVLNMHSVEYGSGKDIWKAFDDACAIAAGVYHPSTKRGSGDNLAVNIAKGVTGAKIAFRFYTAAKQLLSLPAFWNGDAGLKELAKWENPVGAIIAWNWAIKNLPGFSKRWQSRQVGDVRLMDTDSDYAFWRNNMVRALRRGGMWANALVDGMTVAMGARAVYETRKRRYLRNGYSEEQAEKRAMQDAAINYNSSQQSSENAFLSSLQLDRTWWSTLMTVFRSASMGYQRRLTTGLRNLKNRMKKGYKAESIEFMKKQMVRDDIDEATAEKAARRTYRWGGLKSMADVFVFGLVLPFFWNLGPYALYLLMGDDDDEKKDMLKDAAVHSLFGPVEGLTGGQAMSEIGNTWAGYLMSDNDKSLLNALRYHDYLSMPLGSDLQQIFNEAGTDSMAAWTDAFNLLVQAGIGVNPETFTDAWVAIADACDGDPQTTKEFALCFMRVMQVPQTQTDKLFVDELGMTARDAQKLNAMEMAERYARYKKFRNAPLLNWAYSPDESQKVAEKYRKRFLDNMQERMERLDDEQLGWNFENPNDSERREAVGKVYAKGKGVQDSAGKKPASNWKPETRRSQLKYQRLRDWTDLAEDVLLDTAIEQAKNRGDDEKLKALRDAKKELTEIKRGKHTETWDVNGLGDGSAEDDKEIMDELRARRKELLRELGVI